MAIQARTRVKRNSVGGYAKCVAWRIDGAVMIYDFSISPITGLLEQNIAEL